MIHVDNMGSYFMDGGTGAGHHKDRLISPKNSQNYANGAPIVSEEANSMRISPKGGNFH
jgi:hypothetical protein